MRGKPSQAGRLLGMPVNRICVTYLPYLLALHTRLCDGTENERMRKVTRRSPRGPWSRHSYMTKWGRDEWCTGSTKVLLFASVTLIMLLDIPDAGKLPFYLDACHLSAPKIDDIVLLVFSSAGFTGKIWPRWRCIHSERMMTLRLCK